MAKVMTLREQIEALPIHEVGGYEWECDTCHFHHTEREVIVPFVESRVISKSCDVCGKTITAAEDGEYADATGRACDHRMLLDRAAVLDLLNES